MDLELIKRWEGLRLQAYRCSAGVWTIGYGHTATAKKGMIITREQAEKLLLKDARYYAENVRKLLKREPTERQFEALVSLAFNIGMPKFRTSTALKRFNAGDLAGAAEAITWFNKATVNGKLRIIAGLVNRREDERAWFLSDVADAPDAVPGDASQDITGGESKPLVKSKTFGLGAIGLFLSALSAAQEQLATLPIPREYLPWALVGLMGLLMLNRWHEQRVGEH